MYLINAAINQSWSIALTFIAKFGATCNKVSVELSPLELLSMANFYIIKCAQCQKNT